MTPSTEYWVNESLAFLESASSRLTNETLIKIVLREARKLDPQVSEQEIMSMVQNWRKREQAGRGGFVPTRAGEKALPN